MAGSKRRLIEGKPALVVIDIQASTFIEQEVREGGPNPDDLTIGLTNGGDCDLDWSLRTTTTDSARWLAVSFLPAVLLLEPRAPPPGQLTVQILDVGQGLARARHLVPDLGSRSITARGPDEGEVRIGGEQCVDVHSEYPTRNAIP